MMLRPATRAQDSSTAAGASIAQKNHGERNVTRSLVIGRNAMPVTHAALAQDRLALKRSQLMSDATR